MCMILLFFHLMHSADFTSLNTPRSSSGTIPINGELTYNIVLPQLFKQIIGFLTGPSDDYSYK